MDAKPSGGVLDTAGPACEAWPTGEGDLARLIRQFDWAATPLGPIRRWPQSLRSAVGLLLRSPVPIVLLWGPDGVMLYNDAYSAFAGGRHPRLLGSRVREGWPEVADFNDHVMTVGLAGGTLSYRNQELTLYRHGRPEQVFMNLDYSPVEDESGRPAGVVAIVVETTNQVLTERRLRESEERLRAFVTASSSSTYRMNADWSELLEMEGRGVLSDAIVPRPDWIEAYIEPEDRSRLTGAIDRARRTGGTFDVVHRVRLADGSLGWTHSRAVPIRDEAGRVTEWFGAATDVTDRHRAEERLRLSEERFRLATLAVEGMVYDWDLATGRTERTEGLRDLLGYAPEEVPTTAEWWRGCIHPEDLAAEEARGGLRRALEDGTERFQAEYRVRHRDGHWVDVLDTGLLVRGEGGRVVRIVGTSVDVTARKRAEAALRESEARLRALTDHLPAAMVYQIETSRDMTDMSARRYTYVSANCEALTGIAPEEALADPLAFMTMVGEEQWPRVLAEEQAAAREMRPLDIELPARTKDGRPLTVHVFSRPREGPDGRLVWDGLLFDVTELREAERSLRLQAEELATILDAVPAGIWITRDPEGRLITGNSRSHELLRVPIGINQSQSDPEAPAQHFRFLDSEGHELPADRLPVQRAARGEEVRDVEYRISFQDGSHVDIFGNAMPLRDPSGRVHGAVAAFVDISGRKRWEEHQRLLVNELNHRVKNTLATVQSIATQTLRNAASAEEARRALDSRLLALSRTHDILTQESWESADLLDIVVQAIAPYRHAREDRFHLEGRSVRVAPRLALALAMALQELATNAVKYGALSNATGRVSVQWHLIAGSRPPRLRLEWRESGGPPVRAPSRRGFGSRMIERGLAQEIDGAVRIDFAPDGLVMSLEAPLAPEAGRLGASDG